MKIASASLQMEASHQQYQRTERSESLRVWVGNRRPDFEGNSRRAAAQAQVTTQPVQISDAGKAAQSGEANAINESIDAAENDPTLRMIRSLVAMLTGKEVKVFNASEIQGSADAGSSSTPTASTTAASPQTPPNAGFGVEYDSHSSYTESEQTQFAASGVVRTEDGKTIAFSVSLAMERYYHEESSVSIRLGDARQKSDPLVLNFNGNAVQLTDRRFAFDLNSDGKADEQINFVGSGSGFLAFDRNADGAINNGAELFGTKTGDGFAELAKLDGDKNGWIDENDAAFAQLSVWRKDSAGNDQLTSLKEANVGAISLARVATPFDIKDSSNALQGQIRSSGIFLQENGGVGTVQQVDLTV